MAKTNSNATLESLVSTLVATHVDNLLRDLVAGPSRPIDQFDLDGASVFVVYGANGSPLGFGGAGLESPAASRNQTRRRVNQLASTGMITTYRSVALPSDNLVGVLGRMIGGLLGSSVLEIGDGIAEVAIGTEVLSSPVQRSRRGRPAGSTRGAGKGRPGRPRKAATLSSEDGGSEAVGQAPRRRGRKPGSTNASKATGGKRGPGRPRNAASSQPDASVRRRPGRPKKSEAGDDTGAAPVKRKPGRPAKNAMISDSAAPKRRGRPPGSKTRGATKGRRQKSTENVPAVAENG